MPRNARILPALLIALAGTAFAQTATPAAAQPELRPGLSPTEAYALLDSMRPTNAALIYYRFWMTVDPDIFDTYIIFNHAEEDDEETTMSPERATEILESGVIDTLMEAASLEECDFGVAYQDGWSALLPHLGKLRWTTRILYGDTRRLLDQGDADAAADRVAAIYGMAWQAKNDKVLISSLVSAAIANMGHELTGYLIDSGEMSDAQRDLLASRLERFLETDDPFNVRTCIAMEAALSVGWIETLIQDADVGNKLGDKLAADGFFSADDEATRRRLNSLDAPAIRREAEKLSDYYEKVNELWDDPESVEKVQALGALVEAGAFGVLTQTFGASLDRARESELRAIGEVEATLDALYSYRAPDEEADEEPNGQPEATDTPSRQ